jgi:hypothetical protein
MRLVTAKLVVKDRLCVLLGFVRDAGIIEGAYRARSAWSDLV